MVLTIRPDATVDDARLAVTARGDEAPPVRADVAVPDAAGDRDQTLEAGRHVVERRPECAVGGVRRVEPAGLDAEEEREAELVAVEGRSLRREPRQFRGPGPVAGLATLDDRQAPGGDRHHEQHRGRREERAQPTSAAAGGAQLGIVRGARRVEEFPLESVGLTGVGVDQSSADSEPGAAVELGRVSTLGLPAGGAGREVMVETPAVAIVLQPGAGTRPLPEQRLVCDLDAVGTRGDESPVGERGQHGGGVRDRRV